MAVKTHQHFADDFGVPLNTFRRWLKAGAPYQNKAKMITFINNLQRKTPAMKAYLRDQGVNVAPLKSKAAKQAGAKTAEDFRDHYREKLEEATFSNDQDQVKFWSDLFLKQDESIRRSEAHAAKLGIDNGTVMPRAEVERVLRAIFYAGNACVQGNLTSICQQLVSYTDAGDLYHALKPVIVGGRLFSGLDKVMTTKGSPNVPEWFVDCVKLEAKQYLGNSESLWTKTTKGK